MEDELPSCYSWNEPVLGLISTQTFVLVLVLLTLLSLCPPTSFGWLLSFRPQFNSLLTTFCNVAPAARIFSHLDFPHSTFCFWVLKRIHVFMPIFHNSRNLKGIALTPNSNWCLYRNHSKKVLGTSGCCSKFPETVQLKHNSVIFHSFGDCEVHEQGSNIFGAWWGPAYSWFIDECLLNWLIDDYLLIFLHNGKRV
jgi:hypothetical protein